MKASQNPIPPAPQKPFMQRFLEAAPPEFAYGILAYVSAKTCGCHGMAPYATINGRTLALPR